MVHYMGPHSEPHDESRECLAGRAVSGCNAALIVTFSTAIYYRHDHYLLLFVIYNNFSLLSAAVSNSGGTRIGIWRGGGAIYIWEKAECVLLLMPVWHSPVLSNAMRYEQLGGGLTALSRPKR